MSSRRSPAERPQPQVHWHVRAALLLVSLWNVTLRSKTLLRTGMTRRTSMSPVSKVVWSCSVISRPHLEQFTDIGRKHHVLLWIWSSMLLCTLQEEQTPLCEEEEGETSFISSQGCRHTSWWRSAGFHFSAALSHNINIKTVPYIISMSNITMSKFIPRHHTDVATQYPPLGLIHVSRTDCWQVHIRKTLIAFPTSQFWAGWTDHDLTWQRDIGVSWGVLIGQSDLHPRSSGLTNRPRTKANHTASNCKPARRVNLGRLGPNRHRLARCLRRVSWAYNHPEVAH